MNSALLSAYHHSPAWARSLAATVHGWRLHSWRYGPETDRLVEEALEREHWDEDRWKNWRQQRLAYVLRRAATRVPYYRGQWAARRLKGDRSSWENIENWPLLLKEEVRHCPQAFLAEDCDPRRMLPDHTSGSTGTPLRFWRSRETLRARYALYEARHRRWYGVSRHDRWAMAGGQLVTPFEQRQPPFWVWNGGLRQLYLSSYHLSPSFVPSILEALHRYDVRYLWGYPSSLHALAEGSLHQGVTARLQVAVANAEPVFPYQKQAVQQAFGCALRETYGMVELLAAAGECERGALHLFPEMGWLEVLDENGPVENGRDGEFVCTSLLDADMPLIRYRLGDRGAVASETTRCPCGRTLPMLAGLEGRSDDLLYTRDGRRIGRLDPIFKNSLAIREAQIVQESLERVRVRYVPSAGFSAADAAMTAERLRQRMGSIDVVLEETTSLPRGPNGKFHAVVCQLSRQERQQLAGRAHPSNGVDTQADLRLN